jgi:DNA-binding transcriptional MocR family regulator
MPTFHNPPGALMPAPQKQALVELLTERRIPLIEDDVYGELYFGVKRPPPAKSFDREGWVMHCSSFSKSLAPGYRIGWVAAGRFAQRVERLKLSSTLSVAVPSQAAVLHFLRHGAYDKHLRQLRATLAQQQEQALALATKHVPTGTRISQPEGGYFLWAELPPGIDALRLHALALAQNISIAPGPLFSGDRRFTHHVRLNYGHPRAQELEPAIRTLGQLVTRIAAN